MADDQSQRPPYRSNDTIARGPATKAPGAAPASSSGSDPLAELARLIGQSDPFAEFGRDAPRRPAAPATPAAPAADWPPQSGTGHVGGMGGFTPRQAAPELRAPAAPSSPPQMPAFASTPNYGRQAFGDARAAGADLFHVEGKVPGYQAAPTDAPAYEGDSYQPSNDHLGSEEDDFYEHGQPSRRRLGVMVIAGVFALAVLGTAGAFGYRALFGSSGSSAPPPVIKAESAPSKVVPASNKDAPPSKLITDRVNERGQGEKLVSREEQPVEIKDKPAGAVLPPSEAAAPSATPPLGSGVVGTEPKRVRTIAIHPDQAATADGMPTSAPPAAPAPAPARQAAPTRVNNNPPPAAEPEPTPPPASRPPVARAAPAVRQTAAPAPSNAPLSLSPDAPTRAAPARAAAPAARTAAVSSGAAGGGYAVQVSSQRSEADAQAAFRSLQGKFPGQLGSKPSVIHKVDLGAKGTYYRAMVGPFANANEASELCSSLKAAGGQCIVQKN